MSKLKWGELGAKIFETGLSKGVLYNRDATTGTYPVGVPWDGLLGVNEAPSGGEATPFYADNDEYGSVSTKEKFAATIEAYTYPDEFKPCIGMATLAPGVTISQQVRSTFGFVYVTKKGNDVKDDEFGYIIHLIYGAKAGPSAKSYTTQNETKEAITMSWDITTTPVPVTNAKSTAKLDIDSTTVTPEKLALIESQLFGADEITGEAPKAAIVAHLPFPDEIKAILASA